MRPKLPTKFQAALADKVDDPDYQFKLGIDFAIDQVRELLNSKVPGIHFYVLNRSHATAAVLQAVGLKRT